MVDLAYFTAILAFFGAGMFYAAAGADFSNMKEIFLLPCIPVIASALMKATTGFPAANSVLTAAAWTLVFCYAAGCGLFLAYLVYLPLGIF
jgi:hypothetical protein